VVWLNRAEHVIWAQVVSRWAGAALVAHLHGPPVYRRVTGVSHGVAHFIAVSDFVRDAYLERGVRPERITTVHNAIPSDRYPVGGLPERALARRQLGLPPDRPIVLCYGQMSRAKGLLTLNDAWRAVLLHEAEALLVLVDSSSASPDPEVEVALQTLTPSSYARFPITADVLPFLHACDLVAFPTWLPEAFGRVVLEGLATGRPVVASEVGAVGEILSGPMARLLVQPRAAEDLSARLLALLRWREQEPELQRECARWVADRFPFAAHVDALEQLLQRYRP
jgi:glycosyltransferase involved in cell wall biosynthesis